MPNLSDYNPAVKYGSNLDVNVDLGDIRDSNGNEILELDAVASAVNYARLANSATGNAPEISAQGEDTNIDLQISSLGTGGVKIGNTSTATGTQGASVGGGRSEGAATINAQRGVATIPSVGLQTGSAYQLNLTNTKIDTGDVLVASVSGGTNTTEGVISIETVEGSGSALVIVKNGTSVAIDGTLEVNFVVL